MNVPRTCQQAKANPMVAWRWLISVVLVTTLAGCNLASPSRPSRKQPKPTILAGRDSEVREHLLAIIPIGTSIDEAEGILANYGLDCVRTIDERTGQPILSYTHRENPGWLVHMITSLDVECPDGKVSEITCRTIGIGP